MSEVFKTLQVWALMALVKCFTWAGIACLLLGPVSGGSLFLRQEFAWLLTGHWPHVPLGSALAALDLVDPGPSGAGVRWLPEILWQGPASLELAFFGIVGAVALFGCGLAADGRMRRLQGGAGAATGPARAGAGRRLGSAKS